jgi:hypothetical protein
MVGMVTLGSSATWVRRRGVGDDVNQFGKPLATTLRTGKRSWCSRRTCVRILFGSWVSRGGL